ncbi:MAG: cupin domain-containing protein [Planctomycetota bacterium]|nr:cupin domain-containing protein [Planctomycetota bacterium]
MLIKKLTRCPEITANDGCRLREALHPERDPVDIPYSLAFARVEPGEATDPHFLRGQTEVYSLLRGQGRMHVGDDVRDVEAGDTLVIPPGAFQWIENTGDELLHFIALVSPPWNADDDVLASSSS